MARVHAKGRLFGFEAFAVELVNLGGLIHRFHYEGVAIEFSLKNYSANTGDIESRRRIISEYIGGLH